MPEVYNLIRDPKERDNVLFPNTWVPKAALAQLAQHAASLKAHSPIKPGTLDPYEPPRSGDASRTPDTGGREGPHRGLDRTALRGTPMKMKPTLGVLLLVCAFGWPPAATVQEPGGAGRPRLIEPRADEVLRAMSQRLAGLERFAFEAEETFDEIPDGEPRMQLTNVRRAAVERPNRLAADAEGDTLHRAAWLDGGTATVLDKAHNTFGQVEVPPTIDAALDALAERYGIEPPLEDFVFSDPHAVLTEGVRYGRYLGLHHAAGELCHHLAFVQDTVEWQIWIDADDDPLPRKFVITYVREPGEPQYSAVWRKWTLAPTFPEGLFTFEAPPGARRVELSQLSGPHEGGDAAASAAEAPGAGGAK